MPGTRSLGSLTLDLIAKIGGFTGPLDQAGRVADARLKAIEKRAKQFGIALGAAMSAAAVAVAAGVKAAIDQADALNDLHERLGLSAEALSGFAYAAKQTGTDIDALGIGLKKLSKNMAEALNPKSQQAGLFKALDIAPIDKATGKLKSLEQILPEIADRFKGLKDDTLEAALAQELFGKSGTDLLEFLNLGSDGIEDMRSKLRDLGGELSQSTLSAADQFNDKLGDLHTAMNGLYSAVAADLLPTLDDMVSTVIDATKQGSEFRDVLSGLGTVMGTLADFSRNLDEIWRGLVSTAIGLYNAVDNLSKVNPSTALGRWIAGLSGGADSWSDNVREMGEAADQAVEAFDKVGPAAERAAKATLDPRIMPFNLPASAVPAGHGVDSRKLYGFLNGPPDKPKGGGKSDAEREAEQLEAAYKRMKEQMQETLALYGDTSEAAKVRYETEFGELAKLSPAKKQELIDLAKKQDLQKAEAEEMDRLNKLEEERQQTIARAHQNLADTLQDLQFEIDLMGKSNAEREAEIDLQRIGIGLNAQERSDAKERLIAMHEELDAMHKQAAAMDEARDTLSDFFGDFAKNGISAVDRLVQHIEEVILRQLGDKLAQSLLGNFGTTGNGSFLSNLFGSLFGGSSSSSASSSSDIFSLGLDLVGAFAGGTDDHPGGWSIVGEEGPELMNVPKGAQIVPADATARALGGGSTFNFHDTYRAPTSKKTRQQVANEKAQQTQFALRRRGLPA